MRLLPLMSVVPEPELVRGLTHDEGVAHFGLQFSVFALPRGIMQFHILGCIRSVREDRYGLLPVGVTILLAHERHRYVVQREEQVDGSPSSSLEDQRRVRPRVVRGALNEDTSDGVLLSRLLEPLLDGVDVLPLHGGNCSILPEILAQNGCYGDGQFEESRHYTGPHQTYMLIEKRY